MIRRRRWHTLLVILAAASCDGDSSPAGLAPVATTIELSAATLTFTALGDTTRLMATVRDQSGSEMPGAPLTWTSTAPQAASVSATGLVTALSVGPATITATSGSAAASAAVSVTQVPSVLALSPSALDLAGPGDTATVSATVLDAGGHPIPNAALDWLSGDEGIATVSPSGLVTAVASGSASISAELAVDADLLSDSVEAVVGFGVLVGPAGGVVALAGGSAELQIPPGALAGPVFVTADPAAGLPPGAAPVAGTALDLGPDGLDFALPVTLTISYDPADLPPGMPEEELRIHGLVDGKYDPLEGGSVDVSANTVSGTIHGFSVYAVLRELRVTTTSLPDGIRSIAYDGHALAVSGGGGAYAWTVVSGTLPPGVSLGSDGTLSGAPTAAGSFVFTVEVTSGPQTARRALSISVTNVLSVVTAALPGVIEGQPYAETLVGGGGTGVYSWSVLSGSLPAGLALSPGGAITGAPSAPGTSDFVVEVTDGAQSAQRALSITVVPVLSIGTSSLPDGLEGQAYGAALTATGGAGTYSWSLVSGSLPPGLTLDPSGAITGTPTARGTSGFTARVESGTQSAQQPLSITVLGTPATVTDVTIVGRTSTTLTVRFTEVEDGSSAPADYLIRRAVSPIQWDDAQAGETVVDGAQIGAVRDVTIDMPGGLVPYDVRMVAFRGTPGVDAVLSGLSNVATAPVLQPAELCSVYPAYAIARFADAVLSDAVVQALGAGGADGVTCGSLGALSSLSDGAGGAVDLAGAQNLTGLQSLSLGSPSSGPHDLSPLGGLTGLTSLSLDGLFSAPGGSIDLAPLGGLTSLSSLALMRSDAVTSIGPLSSLSGLTELSLDRVSVGGDFGALGGLSSLTALHVTGSPVGDLGFLSGLTDLQVLRLWENFTSEPNLGPLVGLTSLSTVSFNGNPPVRGIQALLDNTGLGSGDSVDLTSTSVSCADVAALEAKGVSVIHDCLRVTTDALPDGAVDEPYSQALGAFPTLGSPLVWSLANGSGPLPPGLALSADGVVSGTPTQDGTWGFTVEATDPPQVPWIRSAARSLSITVVAAPACTLETPGDADGDRLPDCVETNTGTFLGPLDTGTDPNDPDTDGDSIRDGDEVLGTLGGLDLPGLGVSPLVPSILIEYDWFDDSGHTHRPTPTQIAMVTASFAAQGIEVIHDYGQGPAPFDGGNFIADADGNVDGFGPEYYGYKAANFAANRHGYFHYNLHPHRYNNGNSSGLAEINGDDLITATINFYGNNLAVAGTIQHELGHNLGLLHGGNVNTNYKPNYNSVMNYRYQFGGVDNDCTPPPNGVLDYSHGLNPSLNENDLDETRGICGGPPGWDWNQDGDALDTNVVADINNGDGLFSVLHDHDDWDGVSFAGIGDFDGAALRAPPEIVACPEPPPDLAPSQ